jgi:hypothetical protein
VNDIRPEKCPMTRILSLTTEQRGRCSGSQKGRKKEKKESAQESCVAGRTWRRRRQEEKLGDGRPGGSDAAALQQQSDDCHQKYVSDIIAGSVVPLVGPEEQANGSRRIASAGLCSIKTERPR